MGGTPWGNSTCYGSCGNSNDDGTGNTSNSGYGTDTSSNYQSATEMQAVVTKQPPPAPQATYAASSVTTATVNRQVSGDNNRCCNDIQVTLCPRDGAGI